MKRKILAGVGAGLLALGAVATAGAAGSEKASCLGQAASTLATTAPPPSVGQAVSGFAQQQLVDEFSRQFAQAPRDNCPPPPV